MITSIGVGVSITVLVGALFYFGLIRFNYPSKTDYPVRGIDVSHHQGTIDWRQVKSTDIDFVFIKATEGDDFVDPQFVNNWNAARTQGISVGAYHFFTFCSSARDQAANFIKTVPSKADSLPPVIDIEFIGSCKRRPTLDQYRQAVAEFMSLLRQHFGKSPIIYTTYDSYRGYLDKLFADTPVWIRDIYKMPKLQGGREWLFWQYSNRGRRRGIATYVDLNVFRGSKQVFRKFFSSDKPN